MAPSATTRVHHIRLGAAIVATVLAAVAWWAAWAAATGRIAIDLGGSLTVSAGALGALAACVAAVRAGRRATGRERRFWWMLSAGLGSWALGAVPYILFLYSGGDPSNPAPWTQAGFLAAYPAWYAALWLMRDPMTDLRATLRMERLLIEVCALLVGAIIVCTLLWVDALTTAQNVTLLIPPILDLLLVSRLSATTRRGRLTLDGAHAWLTMGFLTLGAADVAVGYLTSHGFLASSAVGLAAYPVAMLLLAVGATHRMRMNVARMSFRQSSCALAVAVLALSSVAAGISPPAVRALLFVMATFLAWRLLDMFKARARPGADDATAVLDREDFERYVSGLVTAASPDRPATVAVVDLARFGEWAGTHGAVAGGLALRELSRNLDAMDVSEKGVWGRLSGDRFAYAGIDQTRAQARQVALAMQEAAATVAPGLDAHAGFAVAPADGVNAQDVIRAAEEAAQAARRGQRRVTAFDGGEFEGVSSDASVGAGLRERRERVRDMLAHPERVQAVYQPIVDLSTGRTVGHESLARFAAEPVQGPDVWIADAHAVGLGAEIEAACLRAALASRPTFPNAFLAVNIGPEFLLSPAFAEIVDEVDLTGVVIEITEHAQVSNYTGVASRLALLRGRGARVAIDDAGAGYSSLRHVMQLRPDFVKVDQSIISGVSDDPTKRVVLRSLLAMSVELGAVLIGEGIEHEDELAVLRTIGVPLGQGYLLGRPAPAATPHAARPGAPARPDARPGPTGDAREGR